MDLAVLLGKSLQEVRDQTSSSEFRDWCWYMREKEREKYETKEPIHHYLARIAYWIVRTNQGKKGRKLKMDNFLINFQTKQEPKSPQERNLRSKMFWMQVMVSDPRRPPKKGK